MQAINGKLVVIDGNQVFWNGETVAGLDSIVLVADKDGVTNVNLMIQNGDASQIASLTSGGIKVRGVR